MNVYLMLGSTGLNTYYMNVNVLKDGYQEGTVISLYRLLEFIE